MKTRLVLLGMGGGATRKKAASAPAQVILVNDVPYFVDCGMASPGSWYSPMSTLHPHEVTAGGVVMQGELVRVTAAL